MKPAAQKKQDELLLQMVYKDFQPFSIVEDVGFQAYSRGLNPGYEMVGRTTLSEKLIHEKYDTVRIMVCVRVIYQRYSYNKILFKVSYIFFVSQ